MSSVSASGDVSLLAGPVELVPSLRGKDKAKYLDRTFTLESSSGLRHRWRCDQRQCKSRLITDFYGGNHMVYKYRGHDEDVHRLVESKRKSRLEITYKQKTVKIGDYRYVLEKRVTGLAFWRCVHKSSVDDLLGMLNDRVDSVTNMARAFLAVFLGAFVVNACAVIFIVFGDGRSRRFLFPLVLIYAIMYLVFCGLIYLFLGLSGSVAGRVRALSSIVDTVSVVDVSDSAFSYIKVHEPECRLRFVCELSEKAVERDHMFALVLRVVSVLGSAGGPYVEAVLGGLSGRGCHLLFSECDYSPLRRSLPFVD